MNHELSLVMSQIEHTKRIDKFQLVDAIKAALVSAARKIFGADHEIDVEFDESTFEFRAFYLKEVVEGEVETPATQMTLEEARLLDPQAEIGGVLKVRIPPHKFGRIAAQTAKQVIVQRVQEAERQSVYDQFKEKEGELLTGTVLRYEGRNVIVSIGDAEALMPYREQTPRERYAPGERMRFLVLEVKKTLKGPSIIVSRAHPNLVRKLFELEVPEIYEGSVKIESVAREAGARTKISVRSVGDDRVDAVGACVGVKGTRVQSIVDEVRGEKVDIVRWDEDPHVYIANALSPARIARIVYHPEDQSAEIVVPNDQLSLAIGKKGQNARLAARLTGTKIDIKSEEQYAAEERARMDAHFQELTGDGEALGETVEDVSSAEGSAPEAPAFNEEGSAVPGAAKAEDALELANLPEEKVSASETASPAGTGEESTAEPEEAAASVETEPKA